MDISNIIYYTRDAEGHGSTVSLRDLCLREDIEFEAIFHAVRDAVDTQDLLDRFRRISCDQIELCREIPTYIMFTVVDVNGNTNYLKFKKRKEQ